VRCHYQFSRAIRADIKEVEKRIGRVRSNNMDQVLLLHNASPQTSLHTRAAIAAVVWTAVPHSPYSPDLTSSHFHRIRSLKDALKRWRFADDGVREELRRFSEEFYANVNTHTQAKMEKKSADYEGDVVKNNLIFVKDVSMVYVNFIIIVIRAAREWGHQEAILSYRPS